MIRLLKKIAYVIIRTTIPLRLYKIFPKDPRVIESLSYPSRKRNPNLCIFASFSAVDRVEAYVLHYLKALSTAGFDIVFVSTSAKISSEDQKKLAEYCIHILRRQNVGYDFGSWKAGLLYTPLDVRSYSNILLTNDSYYAPIYPIKDALDAGQQSDIFGITDSFEIEYHIMSYFVLYNRKAIASDIFWAQWDDVRMIPTKLKVLIIHLYEVGMNKKFRKSGFSVSVYCSVEKLRALMHKRHLQLSKTNAVHRFWKELIVEMRCPILKVDVFKRFLDPIRDETWRPLLRNAGYDEKLILRHQNSLKIK